MAEIKSHRLTSWLLARPTMFMITTTLFMLVTVIASIFATNLLTPVLANPKTLPYILTTTLTIVTFIITTTMLVRGLPAQNLDRRSFVAIINAQTFITSIILLMLIPLITPDIPNLLHMGSTSFVSILTSGLLILYLCGLNIAGLYAKYRRVRAMGVPMWRIICTAPFGFAMLWIPGYLLPAPTPKTPALNLSDGRYARLTDWIIARPTNTAIGFIIMILLSNLLFGFNTLILTLGIALIFSVWATKTGTQKFRTNIAGAYTWTAIGLNVISWIVVVCISIYSAYNTTPANITINGSESTSQITE